MKDNPFAAYAAGVGRLKSNQEDDGWMSTRKDESDVRRSKAIAEEARRARRSNNKAPPAAADAGGGKANKAPGGGRGKTGVGGGRRCEKKKADAFVVDDSDEVSFDEDEDDDDDDDGFVVHSDEEDVDSEEDEELDWDSDIEDEDSDFGGGGRKKKKKAKTRTTTTKEKKDEKRRNDGERKKAKVTTTTTRTTRKSKSIRKPPEDDEDDDDDDDIDGEDVNDASIDDIYAEDRASLGASLGKKTRSRYFAGGATNEGRGGSSTLDDDDDDDGEEKKVEDDESGRVYRGGRDDRIKNDPVNRKRRILDDDSDDDSTYDDAARGGGKSSFVALDDHDHDRDDEFGDDPLSDTPRKSTRPSGGRTTASAFAGPDDYADDDDEARAISEAIKASIEEQRQREGGGEGKIRKRLKKNAATSSSSSSLERIKPAPAAKVVYKDDIEQLRDSDDDDDAQHEDDEIEAYDPADEEEQTAAQVLAEANALSARIIRIVNGWYGGGGVGGGGGDGDDGGKSNNCERVKGLILGEDEGALCLGDRGGNAGGEGGNTGDDETWISDETMKGILPNVKLAEYQLLGVNWMALLNRTKFGGGKTSKNVSGILADEMGLGKTVQTIAFLAWLNHQNKGGGNRGPPASSTASRRPHLIVVPASVLSNWMNEFKKFAPDMIVYKYHGNQMEREQIRDEMDSNFVRRNDPLDAVLTTFSYFSSDSNKGDRSFLRKFNFDYLVVDEGHTLKNPKGLRYQNLNKFQTRSRLLLTGTPVQNSPKELMSLLCFLMPLFDRKTKSSKRKRGYDNDSDDDNDGGERMLEYFVQLEGGSDDAKAYRKLKQLFAPFVLRRKKEDVLSQILPPKTRQVDIVPMDEATQSAYNAIISSHVKARMEKGSGADAQDAAAQKHLFTALRKAANHPLLLRNRFKSEEDKATLAHLALNYRFFGNDASCTLQLVRDELDKFSDYEIHCAAIHMIEENPKRREHLERYLLMEGDLFCSPKFVRLRTLLPELINKGHRVLIFSQWTKILDLMGHLLQALHMDNHLRLDGQTAVSERQDLIDQFTNDSSIPVFLLSTRAGGMGLNLTAADVCILHDLDFNPFNDRQAEDRCHRIGQNKPVSIIKMVTEGTVDEDIYKIQERKSKMNDAIMEKGGDSKQNKSENAEMCRLANAAVERFLKSPCRQLPGST